MQVHRRVGGLPIDTTLLTLGGVVFEKNKNFPKRLKKLIKNPIPYQTGTASIKQDF